MLIPRRIQLAQSNDLQCFHLWSAVVPGTVGLGGTDLKIWVGKLLKRLAGAHAVRLQGFSLEADQFHLVLQWMPGAAQQWSDDEVQRRWLRAHPPRKAVDPNDPNALPTMSVDTATARQRLASLSGFLQLFKQLITFKINRETRHSGTIWQGRFKLAPLPDASAVAGALAFIDLLPVAKGDGALPEESPFSSLHARVAIYKGKYGMPPYGNLMQPDGVWLPISAEVTAELRQDAPDNPPPDMPPDGPGPMPTSGPGGAHAFWLVALSEDGAPNGVLSWLSLRKYLKLIDNLVTQAKAWPHLPADAPGRVLPPATPAWDGVLTTMLQSLNLIPTDFAAQWARLATLRK